MIFILNKLICEVYRINYKVNKMSDKEFTITVAKTAYNCYQTISLGDIIEKAKKEGKLPNIDRKKVNVVSVSKDENSLTVKFVVD